ncbi:benzoate transporter [Agaricicola taiwanensis]|uniref:Benzoate transporter n=2 Tax=Agaricicola taiwanensis TaxID=591372 RepID=A0A8J2YJ90_9RHOB|nr:benzoate transporter [Agaricicola taiwanensis]
MRLSIVTSAIVAALVGFGATLAIIVAAGQAVGADPLQTGSWVAALCLSMAATTGYLSVRYRQPIITAWSTPGAALIAGTGGVYGMNDAVGAFLLAGALILLTAAFRPLGRLVAGIPERIAAAMLAGVLFDFAARVFEVLPQTPGLVLPLVIIFFLVRLFSPSAAVLTVLIGGVILSLGLGLNAPLPQDIALSRFVLVMPEFEMSTLIGLGLPLYLVTMASQNLPGFAVLRTAGYEPPVQPILAITGLASLLTAPFGAHTSNLAAITAALCTGPDVHPDPAKRWMTGPFYALTYLVLAAFGASLVGLFAAMPSALIVTVGGLALLAPLMGALTAAMSGEGDRFSAVVTFVVTASGMSIFGIGSAFWGLLAGLAITALIDLRAKT